MLSCPLPSKKRKKKDTKYNKENIYLDYIIWLYLSLSSRIQHMYKSGRIYPLLKKNIYSFDGVMSQKDVIPPPPPPPQKKDKIKQEIFILDYDQIYTTYGNKQNICEFLMGYQLGIRN